MTVAELVDHLSKLPQDYLVVYRRCSDAAKMEPEEIAVYHANDKRVIQHHNIPNEVMDYRPHHHEPDSKPEFLSVVMFPGN